MAYATRRDVLKAGTVLVRHYDDAFDLDRQCCGALSYYQAVEDQILHGALSYYGRKFTEKVEINVYAPLLEGTPAWPAGFGGADCADLGGGRSRIRIRWFDPAAFGGYKLPAALSHEIGHAYHNWTRCFHGTPYAGTFGVFFERLVSSDGSAFDPSRKPWIEPWGPGSRTEDKFEQFANAFRCFFGVLATRGVSGSGTTDPVVPGFKDPAAHPEWGAMLRLLPELTAYWDAYGLRDGTLRWEGGADGAWVFQNAAGDWIRQSDYYAWQRWGWSWAAWANAWNAFYPTYNRF